MILSHPIPDPMVDMISQRLSLVSSPLRIRVISYLKCHGATSVEALAGELGATQQSVSKALRHLHLSGVVDRRREGRRAWYSLVDPTVVEIYDRAAIGLSNVAARVAPATKPRDGDRLA